MHGVMVRDIEKHRLAVGPDANTDGRDTMASLEARGDRVRVEA